MTLRKFQIYAKLIMIGLVILFSIIFVLSNREPVTVKFLWMSTPQIPKFWFIIAVAGLGALLTTIIRFLGKVWRDYRQMKREDKAKMKLMEDAKRSVQDSGKPQEGAS